MNHETATVYDIMLAYFAEDGLQSDSSSDDDDAASDSQAGSVQAVQHLHNAYSQPLGEHQRCGSIYLSLSCSIVLAYCACGSVVSVLSAVHVFNKVNVAGIDRRFKNRVMHMQPESYDSRGMVEGSSLGSSPKLIAGSFEPIPMSC